MSPKMTYDFSGLNKFVKGISTNDVVRVGVLGKDVARKNGADGMTNAEVGAIHEFGTLKLPIRSFLRMPIHQNSEKIVAETAAGSEKMVAAGDKVGLLKKLGTSAQGFVLDAFATGGFGNWKKNADSTIKRKGSEAPLIDKGELRRAVSFQVAKP